MLQKGFQTFSEKIPIFESVQMAKDYLLKREAQKKGIKTSELGDKEKEMILKNPKFKEIIELTQKSPGYAPMFAKFLFAEGAEIEELKEIMDLLVKYKQNLSKDLSMPVIEFMKIEPTEEDPRPSYEVLGDELRNIPRKVKLRKFYNQLTLKMRRAFQKATDQQIEKLEEISNQLDVMPEKDGLDPWDEFTKNLKKYDDTRTYPEYRDEKVAFGDLIKDADLFIEKWQETDDEMVKKLKDLGAQVGFLYNKDGYTAISTRTPEALRAVAGDTSWCIRNDSTFWSYGQGRVQLVIINKNIPVSNPLSLLGITVNTDESIHTDATRPNQRIPFPSGAKRTLGSLLKEQKFPAEMIDKIVSLFPVERDIKLAMEQFFRNQKDLTPEKIVGSLINVNRGFLSGQLEESEWERIAGVVSEIIKTTENLKTSQFLKFFKENGILSESGWEVFNRVVGDDYTKEDMKKIKEQTDEGFETIEYIIQENKRKAIKTKQEEIQRMKECLESKDNVMDRFNAKM